MFLAANDGVFATDLMTRVRRFMHELVVLGDLCLGEEAFTRFVQEQLVSTSKHDEARC